MMNRTSRRSGQTIFIALVVLFILVVLGLVFTGIVGRNINQARDQLNRTAANDLSEAGIRYAHGQLVNSALGADWRGELIDLANPGIDTTLDPDMLYLRPGTGFGVRSDTDTVIDLGGPDGLGPYTRVQFDRGRSLVRVRYAASDPNIFQTSSVGTFSQPGAARNYLIIESVGRNGVVKLTDPTTLLQGTPIQFRNYANSAAFRTALGEMTNLDARIVKLRKLVAFATIGMIESARFITNIDRVSRPAEIGVSNQLGVRYEGAVVAPALQLGTLGSLPRLQNPPTPQANVGFGGSLVSNASLDVHGNVEAYLNPSLGDGWLVADTIQGTDTSYGAAQVLVGLYRYNAGAGAYQTPGPVALSNATNPSLNSRSAQFSTGTGAIRDGVEGVDVAGYWRGVPYKDPPRMSWTDPQTGDNRFLNLSQRSGPILNGGNAGRFGHGDGVYVNNSRDRQIGVDENIREQGGSENSLVNDWFNPGNKAGWRNSGWKGQYYIPRGAFVQLLPDGFAITRDAAGDRAERTWRRPDGTDTGQIRSRYRIGVGSDGRRRIVNTFTPGVNIGGVLNPADYSLGRIFNGVLYFEGNVRVRGVIPTDVQLTLVSNATIYVEGSITKGVTLGGARINRPSRSSLALLARDYVALNPTMFFGPNQNQNVQVKPGADAIMMNQGESIELQAELLLDPNGLGATQNNPATWSPFISGGTAGYQSFSAPGSTTGTDLLTNLVLSHAMDDGAGSYSMVSMDVNPGFGLAPSNYLFPLAAPNSVLGVAPYLPGYLTPGYAIPNFVPIYGLGAESWQRFPKFETLGLPLFGDAISTFAFPTLTGTGGSGLYQGVVQDTNVLSLRPNSLASLGAPNGYLMSRAAIVPHDIRIEAAMYAERGSFVVIPGYWFNNNPNDSRDAFETDVTTYQANGLNQAQAVQAAQADRLSDYGATPDTPFYSEPLNVRIEIVGAVSENMPLPMSYQSEWMKKWGWMPRQLAGLYRFAGTTAERVLIPWRHVPAGYDIRDGGPNRYVPNLFLTYDPMLATGRVDGFVDGPNNPYVRVDDYGRPLAPMPRLPVSPTLSYFGEVLN